MLAAGESATGGGIPPLPTVYQGQVYVDGDLYQKGDDQLTVKIGDWIGRAVPIKDGNFENLIAGPPNIGYVGMDTTFHLGELVGTQMIPFSMLTEPSFEPLRIDFVSALVQVSDSTATSTAGDVLPAGTAVVIPEAGGLQVPWLILILLFSGGGLLVVMLNYTGRLFFK
jgi:hypothetical protein